MINVGQLGNGPTRLERYCRTSIEPGRQRGALATYVSRVALGKPSGRCMASEDHVNPAGP